jgi:transposase-like protein
MPRKKARTRHPNKGARWTPEVEQDMIADYERGVSLVELARSYGRTRKAVVARLQKRGVMSYDPDETGERY